MALRLASSVSHDVDGRGQIPPSPPRSPGVTWLGRAGQTFSGLNRHTEIRGSVWPLCGRDTGASACEGQRSVG